MTRTPYAQFARNVLCGLAAVAALGSVQVAHAGYAQVTPPAGWAAGGGAGGSFVGTKAANTATFLSGNVTTNASLNVGGRAVTMPATMRFAANAPRIAASAVMLHPGIRTAAAVAGWLGLAGLFWDEASKTWKAPDPQSESLKSDGFVYWPTYTNGAVKYSSFSSACTSIKDKNGKSPSVYGQYCMWEEGGSSISITKGPSSCPSGWYITPAGCTQTPQPKTVTQEEAVEEIIKHPMPDDAPKYIPEPLPVEMPYMEPVYIPTGNPVANPKYDPSKPLSPENQPFVQPGTKVTPAPAPGAPWQVDTTPVNRPTGSPQGTTEPVPDSPTEPSTDTPREDGKEDRDFCDKNPNALACLELDTPEGEIPKGTFNVTYSVENSWGNGSCPADKYATLAGKSIKVYDWAQTCDYVATYVRPILLLLCALGALFIVMPGRAET